MTKQEDSLYQAADTVLKSIEEAGQITINALFGKMWKVITKSELEAILLVLVEVGVIAKFTIERAGKAKIIFTSCLGKKKSEVK